MENKLLDFIQWYKSVQGNVSHADMDWFVEQVKQYILSNGEVQ